MVTKEFLQRLVIDAKLFLSVYNVKSWAAQYENKLYLSHCTFWIWCYAVVCPICWRKQLREIMIYHVNSGSPITPHIVFIKVLLQHDDSNLWNIELLKSFLVGHGEFWSAIWAFLFILETSFGRRRSTYHAIFGDAERMSILSRQASCDELENNRSCQLQRKLSLTSDSIHSITHPPGKRLRKTSSNYLWSVPGGKLNRFKFTTRNLFAATEVHQPLSERYITNRSMMSKTCTWIQ